MKKHALLGACCLAASMQASAALTYVELYGTMDESGYVSDPSTYELVPDLSGEGNPVSGLDFTLSFLLDDSIPGVASGSSGSRFVDAVSDLSLNILWDQFWYAPTATVSEYVNGLGTTFENNQWSIFDWGNATGASVDIVDAAYNIVDTADLDTLWLFLMDYDANLFASIPPELVVFDGSEFESANIELGFSGTQYNYGISGTINAINVMPLSPVPVPAAVWLFGSGLLGLVSIARRKTNA